MSEPVGVERLAFGRPDDEITGFRREGPQMRGQCVDDEPGERDGPVTAHRLRRPEPSAVDTSSYQLTINAKRSPEEVDAVDRQAGHLTLAQPGSDAERN